MLQDIVIGLLAAGVLLGAAPVCAADPPTASVAADNDLGLPPPSSAARDRLDRVRDSVVQVRGFFGDSQADAFHGSGFAASTGGLFVTNYHVVLAAVLYPRQYRLEFLAPNGANGKLSVHAIDVEHDLAIVKAENHSPAPIRIRTQIPGKGERAYSIGFPLDLGLTITEGVANGLVENSLEQRIHYSGAMNGGMSGGPALDNAGAAYGVNVSVITGRQLVSFVVPAKHIAALLARAQQPLDLTGARTLVSTQLTSHQAALFASIPDQLASEPSGGYALPAKVAASFECNSDGSADASKPLRVEAIGCAARVGIFVEDGLETGDIRFQHRILETDKLHPLQFAEQINRVAVSVTWGGSAKHVAPFACTTKVVALRGFDARVGTCVRQYRMFANLYDIGVVIVSLNASQRAVVSNLNLRGVAFDSGMNFVRRYLGALQWNP